MHNVSLVRTGGVVPSGTNSDAPCIGLLFNDDALAQMVVTQLSDHVAGIPCVSLSERAESVDIEPARLVQAAHVFLVTDWPLEQLSQRYELPAFASVMLAGALVGPAELTENMIPVAIDEQTGERVADEVRSRLFPSSDTQRLQLALQNEQQERWLAQIGNELSVFYHSISNPLTILSGNIQLLQMLTDSMQISADLMKPIADIATVSARFEEDLKAIAALKEKIRAGNLEKGEL
ncbi:MAG: hypothetical protein AAF564_00940 [Bacteroidota bacterium]